MRPLSTQQRGWQPKRVRSEMGRFPDFKLQNGTARHRSPIRAVSVAISGFRILRT